MKNKLYLLSIIVVVLISINAVVPYILKGNLDIGQLDNYTDTYVPPYIFNEKTHTDTISDEIATLGRVLFYDNHLSLNESISCASCHKQEFAFGDTLVASPGFDKKLTERHSPRLLNLNYSHMPEVFWDRRAGHLDSLPLMVLSNSIEMGFSGEQGQPAVDSLVNRLLKVDYYETLFQMAYGDSEITIPKVNLALTQFVRSIESYDSKYDIARSMVDSARQEFPLFTELENYGKDLYFSPFGKSATTVNSTEHLRQMGCAECHGIDNFTSRKTSLTGNNGIIGVIDHPSEIDTTVKRSPSLRDLFNPQGVEIGPYMHDGSLQTLEDVMDHYSTIGLKGHDKPIGLHTSLDIDAPNGTYNPAGGSGGAQGPPGIVRMQPRLFNYDIDALVAFMKTLSGSNIYTDEKWSDPFDENGSLTVTNVCETNPTRTENITICEGESYKGYYASGQYKKHIKQVNSCDSILNIDLTVLPLVESYHDVSICRGESYLGYDKSGIYHDILKNENGCDSIRWISLEVLPIKFQRITKWICEGLDYEGYTERGSYRDTFPSANGCDSIRSLNLIIYDYDELLSHETICEGESYNGYTESGEYDYFIYTPNECDLRHYLTLTVLERSEKFIQKEICEDEEYEGYKESGFYADTLVNYLGCDSIRTIDLTVIKKTESFIQQSICEGESYEGYSINGSFVDILENKEGCDSTRIIELNILEHSESINQLDICQGEEIEGYTTSGFYTDILTNAVGCDSTRHIQLNVLENTESYYSTEICDGESYEGYSKSGSYIDILQNYLGCDSTRYIDLTILYPSESYEESHICPGENYDGYTEGDHYELYTNAVGCDSLRIINVVAISDKDIICTPTYDDEYKMIDDSDYINLYPNPVVDIMNVKIDKPDRTITTLSIYGPDHNLVYKEDIDRALTKIDISDLPSGIYIVHMKDGMNRFVGKVLKI